MSNTFWRIFTTDKTHTNPPLFLNIPEIIHTKRQKLRQGFKTESEEATFLKWLFIKKAGQEILAGFINQIGYF